MSQAEPRNATSWLALLFSKMRNVRFRQAYFEKTVKSYVANQIRALRGDETQKAFGKRLGMTQSVVSRLEDESYGTINTQTLIDIAKKLDVGLIIKFVDFPSFLRLTSDISEAALKPRPFDESQVEETQDQEIANVSLNTSGVEGTYTVVFNNPQPASFYSGSSIPGDSLVGLSSKDIGYAIAFGGTETESLTFWPSSPSPSVTASGAYEGLLEIIRTQNKVIAEKDRLIAERDQELAVKYTLEWDAKPLVPDNNNIFSGTIIPTINQKTELKP